LAKGQLKIAIVGKDANSRLAWDDGRGEIATIYDCCDEEEQAREIVKISKGKIVVTQYGFEHLKDRDGNLHVVMPIGVIVVCPSTQTPTGGVSCHLSKEAETEE
jgi:hypothetical protein